MTYGDALVRLAQIVDGVVAQACHRHYSAPTQEHQFTSKVAEIVEREIERELRLMHINNVRVEVLLQDFGDRGPRSTERPSGADLYISLVLKAPGILVNKGMLVQSKWDDTMTDPRMQARIDKLLARSPSSYVWIYEPANIVVVPAAKVSGGEFDRRDTQTVGQMIANGLRCSEGDPSIGRPLGVSLGESLRRIQEEVAANRVLSVTVRA